MFTCRFCQKECKTTPSFLNHERCCPSNPNRNYKNNKSGKSGKNQYSYKHVKPVKISDESRRKWFVFAKNRKHSQITKDKISQQMQMRHQQGKAHNIGQSRWNNEPSYPEKSFMKVIENHFNDKNYTRESILSLNIV